ncbi:hypothetical protein MMC2321_01935 [Chitinophaga sp. MM2321]
MKSLYAVIALNTVSLLGVGIAGYMAIYGIGNWGWFLVIGFMTVISGVKFGKE